MFAKELVMEYGTSSLLRLRMRYRILNDIILDENTVWKVIQKCSLMKIGHRIPYAGLPLLEL